MKQRLTPEEWTEEFESFVAAEPLAAPPSVSESILARVQASLNPPLGAVFMKATLVHVLVGGFTLLLCPQFGIGGPIGLLDWLLAYGHLVCMVGCGAFFVGSGALMMSLLLRAEEVRALRRSYGWPLAVLAGVSFLVLAMLGDAQVLAHDLAWLVGALAGGYGAFLLGWRLRSSFRSRLVFGS